MPRPDAPALAALALTLSACTAARPPAAPRPADEALVVAAVQRLFDAMAARDTTALRAVLHPRATLVAVDSAGHVERVAADPWIRSVGASTEALHERIAGPVRVEIDGPLATAWLGYTFHLGSRFSHCGTDAVQFVRVPGGAWRAVTVAFTMRRASCPR